MSNKLKALLQLRHLGRPIATFLLLWPTLGALWIAAEGVHDIALVAFFLGLLFLMHCAALLFENLVSPGEPPHKTTLSTNETMVLLAAFCLSAFLLILFTNTLTTMLSLGALLIASLYPLARRHTSLTALVSGSALSFGIPMAFAAQRGDLPPALWLLFLGNLLWFVAYEAQRGMATRESDQNHGIKSIAILMGDADHLIIATLQGMYLLALFMAGVRFELGAFYNAALGIATAMFIYQHHITRGQQAAACMKAYRHNNWVGLVVFSGIVLHYLFDSIL